MNEHVIPAYIGIGDSVRLRTYNGYGIAGRVLKFSNNRHFIYIKRIDVSTWYSASELETIDTIDKGEAAT